MLGYSLYGITAIRAPSHEQLTESKYRNPYMFTGRRLDTETALYYYRARYLAEAGVWRAFVFAILSTIGALAAELMGAETDLK